jgi:ribosomal protein S8E
MSRGYLGNLTSNPAYAGSTKDWCVTLQQSTSYWYDLIVNPPDFVDTKNGISSQLVQLRARVEQTLEKRFIYFFASRTKVRFDTTRQPKYSFWKKWLVITLLVGRDRRRHTIKLKFGDSDGIPLTPRVEVSERFIRIIHSDTASDIFSVHDFLQTFDIEMGITTQVHYVGITKDPADRPLSRKHRGITDTLYNVSNEENDFFIFVNLFKVMSNAKNDAYGLRFVVANSMIDEIPTDEEGLVVESALIAYFDCASQHLNRGKERAVLSNQLASLAEEYKIQSVSVHLEMESPNEYFVFGSDAVAATLSHSFLYRYANGKVEIERFASEEELRVRLDGTHDG